MDQLARNEELQADLEKSGRGSKHGFAEPRREDLEGQPELQVQLVLPLVDKAARSDDQTSLDVFAQDELLDVEPGHYRLAGAGIVRQEEPERSAREQLAVDGPQLMGQGLDV